MNMVVPHGFHSSAPTGQHNRAMYPEEAWRKGEGDYIKRYAIIILRQKTKEASISLCREAISFELLPTCKVYSEHLRGG